jgi:hypothetical protein
LETFDKECKARRTSRSRFFRLAVERMYKQEKASKAGATYVQGYRSAPELKTEVKEIQRIGTQRNTGNAE